jgi:lipopolysaccharide transport system ATP-binding protein
MIGHEREAMAGTMTFRDSLTNTLKKPMELITGHQLKKEKFWALKDVNLEIEQGDVVGIIGRNGSGKSTLLKILSRIVEPTKGEVIMRGRVASLLEIGTGFHPELTGRENVYFNGAILGMTRKEIQSKFDEIVAFSEVEKFLDTPVKFYSSGMYVRLAFAVSAHLDPDILIVDEVLAVGDAAFQKKCLGKMKDVAGQGRTVLFVSHNTPSVASLCNKAVLMKEGELARSGPTREILDWYLNEEIIQNTSLKFNPPLGNDTVVITQASVESENGKNKSEFGIDEAIYINFEIRVLKNKIPITPNIHVKNSKGELVFISSDQTSRHGADSEHAEGQYLKKCIISGNLLSPDTYFVGLATSTMSPVKGHFFAQDVLAFKVTESHTGNKIIARGNYEGDLPGIIRPVLEWQSVKKLNNRGDK